MQKNNNSPIRNIFSVKANISNMLSFWSISPISQYFSPFFFFRFDDEDVDGVQIRSYVSTLHPDYNAGNTNNDVCLLRLNEPLNLTANGVKAIELNRFDDWSGGEPFTVSGWGTLQVNLWILQGFKN